MRGETLNGLSFDVEDWYHSLDPEPTRWRRYEDRIVEPTRSILELLDEAATKATFFVLGDVAERQTELVREIHGAGHEIASHGCEHRFVYDQRPEAFRDDVERSRQHLERLIDEPVVGYRAPYFSITNKSRWALTILRELGFRYDSSIFPVVNHRYGIPGAPRLPHRTAEGLTEVPIATFPIGCMRIPCGGGAYFRLLPYRVTCSWLRRLNRRGEPFVFYLHPWELDPNQPVMKVRRSLRLRHYHGLARTRTKLQQLLRDFRFGPIRSLIDV